MRKRVVFGISMFLGLVLLVAVAEANWIMGAIIGPILGFFVALTLYTYPRDAAPPADRRHEATQRRRREQARASS
jgi:hypothetical protein